jgi:signal transduction histidine kinase
VLAYADFVLIMDDIRYLETTDRIRGKTLELRRHEKNYLRGDLQSAEMVRSFHGQVKSIIRSGGFGAGANPSMKELEANLDGYGGLFDKIVKNSTAFRQALKRPELADVRHSHIMPLVEASFMEHPVESGLALKEMLKKILPPPDAAALLKLLVRMDDDIRALRHMGEGLIEKSESLDRAARGRIEGLIRFSRTSALVLMPSSFFIGIVLLYLTTQRAVGKLRELEATMEKIGHGYFPCIAVTEVADEVDKVEEAFNRMSEILRQREEQLLKKDEELHRSRQLAALGTLASGIAHELNNPLNNIHLAAQTLSRAAAKGGYPAIIVDSVSDIHTQTMRVKKIVGDILEFAKSRKPEFEQVELYDLVTGVYRRLEAASDLSGVDFSVSGEGFLYASRPHLEQIFINLFSNALDAMDSQDSTKVRGTLKVGITVSPQSASITVSDSGRGIAADSLDRVFQPFFTGKEKGTGLGLFIVYNIVRKHDGDITVESRPGEGTTFTITLPAGNTPEDA